MLYVTSFILITIIKLCTTIYSDAATPPANDTHGGIPESSQTVQPDQTGQQGTEQQSQQSVQATPIISKLKHIGLLQSFDAQLQKLDEYEQAYGSALAERLMIFAETPGSTQAATSQANDMAKTLKEFAKYDIAPLVIFEPTANGDPLDFTAYRNGSYDAALDTYFKTLKANGITDDQMGIWAPFAEGNTPAWGNTDPNLFAANVTKTVRFQKQYFPGSKASILLNSQTYPSNDADWEEGRYSSLVPYVKDIPAGLLDSVGMQGLPWRSPANGPFIESFDATEFLRADLVVSAARQAGVQDIWFNTGTFGYMYTQNSSKTIQISVAERQQLLNQILGEAKEAQAAGFNVAVNLFCADKTHLSEDTDWSYWPAGNPSGAVAARNMFTSFVESLHQNGLEFWMFDAVN